MAGSSHNHRRIRGWLLVSHIKSLIPRAQIFFRGAMALYAPLHLQRRVIKHQRHPVNGSMASVAAYALVDVNAVIKINEVGKIVDPVPDQRLSRPEAFTHRLEQRG